MALTLGAKPEKASPTPGPSKAPNGRPLSITVVERPLIGTLAKRVAITTERQRLTAIVFFWKRFAVFEFQ
jgi:hypothetical protein